ncbi:type VI secretion protein [Streptomyces luteireticuli]|uniref:Type IV secretory system conjugative DNA transfer family protein n=1 Tax=Streptomyces luteireticuli TaxID=173858 RepID=A0ABP3IRJ9_9ACTN
MAEGQRTPGGGVPDGLLVSAIALLLGVTLLAWTATGLSGFFTTGDWPEGVSLMHTPQAMRRLMSDPRDLPAAWPDTPREQLSGYGLFWGVAISEALVTTVLAVFLIGTVGRWRRGRTRPGSVPAVPPQPSAAERTTPLPPPPPPAPEPTAPTPPPAPSPLERVVYRTDRRALAARAVLDASGPVLVITSDPGLWAETKDARAKLGPVRTFDPGHLLDTPDRFRWNPATGCESRDTAAARATALLAPVRPPSTLDSLTAETAETLLRCWLHAAAVDGRPFRQVHRWAQGGSAHEAVRILRTNPKAAGGAAGELESALTGHPERHDMARELTSRALNCLSSVHIRDACSPNRADALALESFVSEGGTLYVVGEAIEDPRTRPGAMPLLTALAANVVERGRGVAERSPSGRLDPPLSLVLDDVAAVAPLPTLPELVAGGEELGLPTLALMRSEEQARSRWPRSALCR